MNIEKIKPQVNIIPKAKAKKLNKQKQQIEVSSFVKEQVLSRLGQPDTLKFVNAANVFDNNWRVDVWCHFESEVAMIKPAKIKHSYFVKVDEHGKFISSSPEIKKEY